MMIRYHFIIRTNMGDYKTYLDARNPMSAFNKAKRLFPKAKHIHLVRAERDKDY